MKYKYKYKVGDRVVLRNDPMLGTLMSAEVTIKAQEISVGEPCYRVTTIDPNAAGDSVWEGYISGAVGNAQEPVLWQELTHTQLVRAGLGCVVSDEYGKTWVKIGGGKWAGGSKDEMIILTTKALWDKFMSLELRKAGL
jgi:hypothetical protein